MYCRKQQSNTDFGQAFGYRVDDVGSRVATDRKTLTAE